MTALLQEQSNAPAVQATRHVEIMMVIPALNGALQVPVLVQLLTALVLEHVSSALLQVSVMMEMHVQQTVVLETAALTHQ
jgi:hypothetical protein